MNSPRDSWNSRMAWKPVEAGVGTLVRLFPRTMNPPNPSLPHSTFGSKLSKMDCRGIITIEPGKRGGKSCVRGMRITVYDVLGWLSAGMCHAEILEDFPDLNADDIRACLAFVADRDQHLVGGVA